MNNHNVQINFVADNPQATWLDEQGSDRIKARMGDSITFHFKGPGQVGDALMMSGPRRKDTSGAPFEGGGQINIEPDTPYTIDKEKGLWGFSIMFKTSKDGVDKFYFLPDPELEVGSN